MESIVVKFDNRFEHPIVKGKKVHTIRKDKENKFKKNIPMECVANLNGHPYPFARLWIQNTQKIQIFSKKDDENDCVIMVGDRLVLKAVREKIAKNSGFDSLKSFTKYILKGKDYYKGKIIHWTYLKY